MKRIYRLGCCWVLLLGLLFGCEKGQEKPEEVAGSKTLSVYVVNYPLRYFAERIGGDLVEVRFPAPADADPAYWSPGPEVIAAYQQADLVLLNGADYAKWIRKVSMPTSKMVDTSGSFSDRLIELEEQATHSHGPEGEHAHGRLAFTTWLDITLAVEQARAVKDAFSAKLPDSKIEFANRFAELEKELLEIDKQLKGILSANSHRPIVFSHPVYQYFARRYGLNSKSVHWEPDETPTEPIWGEFKELLARHPARWMIWEDEPTAETVAGLTKLGVGSVVFDPCGNVPASGDFLSAMRSNLANLQIINGGPGS
jgi:zinc transport system substrate-binding protein